MSSLKPPRNTRLFPCFKDLYQLLTATLMVVLLATVQSFGQAETGQITGTVTDTTGALIPGATVVIRSIEKRTERTLTTNENGAFTLTNLLPGGYEVQVEAPGFARKTVQAKVTIGARIVADVQLSVEEQGAIVEISGNKQINIETPQIATTISEKQIRELPTITRNPYDLVALSGNISPKDESETGLGTSINGQRAASINILLDGADNNDNFSSAIGQNVPLDSVQEFSVVTGGFSAEYGRASGGIINVATKSGSNEFHGTAYEFNRISALASNGYDHNATGIPKATFTRNQFGYSIGGPIKKDKLFFFASEELVRVRSTTPTIFLVPTPELIAASNAATQSFFRTFPLKSAINGRVFTRAEVTSLVGTTGGVFDALPGNFPVFGQSIVNLASDAGADPPQNTHLFVGRVDWNINSTTSFYGRYALERRTTFPGTVSASPYQGFDSNQLEGNYNTLLSLTQSLTPRLTLQSKFVYNRIRFQQPLGERPLSPQLYSTSIPARVGGSLLTFPGYTPDDPFTTVPNGGPQNLYQSFADASYQAKDHELRFGGSYIHIRDNRTFGFFGGGLEVLGGNVRRALDNLILGRVHQVQAAIDPQGKFPGDTISLPLTSPNFSRNNRFHDLAFYVNDAWKVHSHVKLNLGLRYEYFGVQHNADPRLDSNLYFGPGKNMFEQLRNATVQIAPDSPVGGLYHKDLNNFAPRLGFAWDVLGDGKTSLRGGYGIGYERNFGAVNFEVLENPPNFAVVSLIEDTAGIKKIPLATSIAGLFPTGGRIQIPQIELRHINQNIRTAYAHTWSLSLEHEVAKDVAISLDYSGSKGVKLYTFEDLNRLGSGAVYLGDADPEARLLPRYADLNTRGNNGSSLYHSLTFKFDAGDLFNSGLNLTANYTWAHAIDNLSSTFSNSDNNFNYGLLDPFNPKLDRGDADFDIRHRIVVSGIWEIPYAHKLTGLPKRLLDGWQLSGIFQASTGTPFTVWDGNQTNAIFSRLVEVAPLQHHGADNPPPVPGQFNLFKYIDLSNQASGFGAYLNPITGSSDFGPFPSSMTGRNVFRGPGQWNADVGLSKRVNLTEKILLQMRLEIFNLANHANLFINTEQTDVSRVDYVPAFRDGRRQVQLGLKLIF
ncbi:MAG: TonB-dependent receptor [Blastocatellia bacterium]|nr:TonB-dependent receptor [Blastocatellia bacterium]